MKTTGSVADVCQLDTVLGTLRLTSLEGTLVRIELRPETGPARRTGRSVGAEGDLSAAAHELQRWLGLQGLHPRIRWRPRPSAAAVVALRRYLSGRSQRVEIAARLLGTAFQRRVWDALRRIPYGEVRSYGEMARQIGLPGAARAVGTACGANPLPLYVPCHRVVAAGGRPGGFGGGLDLKRQLLAIEGCRVDW